mmetsp:Transcript_41718/g.116288  ORF Transcript_41718/g.116288 Transcript_41718/m.116288 type:complete len:87 (+) Transcript_41718:363-623(+)
MAKGMMPCSALSPAVHQQNVTFVTERIESTGNVTAHDTSVSANPTHQPGCAATAAFQCSNAPKLHYTATLTLCFNAASLTCLEVCR